MTSGQHLWYRKDDAVCVSTIKLIKLSDGRIGWNHYYSHCELKLIAQSYSASYSAPVMTGSEFGLIKELENKGIENSGKVNRGLVENKCRTCAIETNRPSSFHEIRYAGCVNR